MRDTAVMESEPTSMVYKEYSEGYSKVDGEVASPIALFKKGHSAGYKPSAYEKYKC